MRRLLIILFLLSAFLFYSYAGQEEDEAKVITIDPDELNTNLVYDWPLWLYNHGYVSFYDSNWRSRGGQGAIVLRKPPSFGESFLDGLSKGISKGVDNYYRAKEHKQYTEAMMALIKLKWASEGKDYRPKSSKPHDYWAIKRYFVPEREDPALWLEKQKKKETKFSWLDKFPPPNKIEKEGDDLTKFMRSVGAVRSWEHKAKKLNEYLKSQGLSPVPTNVDVNQVYDGEWVIFWDGEKWARKKKR